jgi:hypothetical protein
MAPSLNGLAEFRDGAPLSNTTVYAARREPRTPRIAKTRSAVRTLGDQLARHFVDFRRCRCAKRAPIAQAARNRPLPVLTYASGECARLLSARRPFQWVRVMPGTECEGNCGKGNRFRTVSLPYGCDLTPGVISDGRGGSRNVGQLSPFPAGGPRTWSVSTREYRGRLST